MPAAPAKPATQHGHQPLSALLKSIERSSGLSVCLKQMAPSLAGQALAGHLEAHQRNHLTAFCRQVKVTRNDRCRQCDLRDVPAKAASMPLPFVNRCHADASEIIIPVAVSNNLLLIGYLGQFRESSAQPESLPLLGAQKTEHLLSLCLLLQRYLLYEIEHFANARDGEPVRETQIRQFLQTRFRQNPSLGDLAQVLGLSASRTGHLIKELTSRNFVDLKQHYRIEAACNLLTGTLLTIEQIAEETGFADPRYFYRVFNEATGMTPANWRAAKRSHTRLQA